MKLVYIEWEDAHSQHGWHTRDEVQGFLNKIPIICQVGWVFEETERYILLVARYSAQGVFAEDDDESFGHLQRIPKTWIKKRVDLTKHIV